MPPVGALGLRLKDVFLLIVSGRLEMSLLFMRFQKVDLNLIFINSLLQMGSKNG